MKFRAPSLPLVCMQGGVGGNGKNGKSKKNPLIHLTAERRVLISEESSSPHSWKTSHTRIPPPPPLFDLPPKMEEEEGPLCQEWGGWEGIFHLQRRRDSSKNWNIAGKLSVGAIGGSKEKAPVSPLKDDFIFMGSSPSEGKNRRVSNLCIFFLCAWESVGCCLAGVLWDFPLLTPFRLQGGCYCFSSSFSCLKMVCKSSFSHLTKRRKAIIFQRFFSHFF